MDYEENVKKFMFKNFYPQTFCIPSGIMHYITFTPSSGKGYEKLQKSCKYFYCKKQLIVFDHFKWSAMQKACRNHLTLIDFENSTYKIWLAKELIIYGQNNASFIPTLMPRIYRSDISKLNISNHDISYKDYKILVGSGNVIELTMNEAMVLNENGNLVPFEDIIELLPKLFSILCTYLKNNELIFTPQTAAKLAELPQFKSLNKFVIFGISDLFNPYDFCKFYKKHENASYFLQFSPAVTPESHHKFMEALEDVWVDYSFNDNGISINNCETC